MACLLTTRTSYDFEYKPHIESLRDQYIPTKKEQSFNGSFSSYLPSLVPRNEVITYPNAVSV